LITQDQPVSSGHFIVAISPQNPNFFNFSPLWSIKTSAGRVKKYLGQRQAGFLIIASQKYDLVMTGQGLPLAQSNHL